jgi:hypothetical protein
MRTKEKGYDRAESHGTSAAFWAMMVVAFSKKDM